MIDRVHTKYGHGFKGIAAYLLHDKDADTRERVVWTETRNLSTNNPDAAWRVMAMTAMDQDRLKREAGIRPGGKPSKGPVFHLTLSWHAEEKDGLTKDEMLRAAYGALRAVRLEDRQALIVCHKDEPQPHVHIVVNRVSPQDGRLPRDYRDYDKLSRWAKKYEKERGKIYCPQRVVNEKARDRGEFVRARGNKARHLVEMQQALNDNDAKKQLEEQHNKAAHAIKQRQRKLQAQYNIDFIALEFEHKRREREITKRTDHAIAQEKLRIRNGFRKLWDAQYHQQQAELRRFKQDEGKAIGTIKNALQAVDFKGLLDREGSKEDDRATTLSEAFDVLGNGRARRQAIERRHTTEEQQLEAKQKAEEQEIADRHNREHSQALSENRDRLEREHNDLFFTLAMEEARVKADWLQKGREMRRELMRLKEAERDRELEHDQQQSQCEVQPQRELSAADPPTPQKTAEQQPANDNTRRSRTSPGDLLPKDGAGQAANQIDEFADRFEGRRERDWSRGRDHDHNRDDDHER